MGRFLHNRSSKNSRISIASSVNPSVSLSPFWVSVTFREVGSFFHCTNNLNGVVVQDFYSVLPSFHIVLCIPLICWVFASDSKLVQ